MRDKALSNEFPDIEWCDEGLCFSASGWIPHKQTEPGSLLVRRGKGGRGRTVPLHPDLASLFANWPTSYGPRDPVVGLTRKTALRHLRAGIEHAGLDEESPGTGRQRAGAHSLRHNAARHWLTTAGISLNVVSQWLGHANPEVTLRIYLPIVGSTHSMADVP